MIHLIARNLEAARAACARHGVRSLTITGPLVRGDQSGAVSDIDFLVELDGDPSTAHRSLQQLREDFAGILGRAVVVMPAAAVTDPMLLADLKEGALQVFPP
jgi:predicted nucleotidyltransferase